MPRPKPKGDLRGCDGFDPRPCAFCKRSFTPTQKQNTAYCPRCTRDRRNRKNKAHAFTVQLAHNLIRNCTRAELNEIIDMRAALGMSTEFDFSRGQFIEDRRSIR